MIWRGIKFFPPLRSLKTRCPLIVCGYQPDPGLKGKRVDPEVIIPLQPTVPPEDEGLCLSVDKENLIKAQKNDRSLSVSFSLVNQPSPDGAVSYLLDDGVLMRRWTSGFTHGVVCQIVLPTPFRRQVLSLAHDHVLSGHLGIKKTYQRVLCYFFWPGLKSDVTAFCRSCHSCQLAGKLNQIVPVAPLKPIPIVGEPFEYHR